MTTCTKTNATKSKAELEARYQEIPIFGPLKPRPIVDENGLADAVELLRHVAIEASAISSQVLAETLALNNAAKTATLKITSDRGATATVALAEYAARLLTEIDDYGRRMEAETAQLPAGKVARRTNADRIAFTPQLPEDADDDAVPTEKTGEKVSQSIAWKAVSAAAHAVLKKLGLDKFWKFELKPDISTAKAALSRGEVTEDQLAEQGMQLVKGERRVDITVEGCDFKKLRDFFGF